jgi:hypothetical protein
MIIKRKNELTFLVVGLLIITVIFIPINFLPLNFHSTEITSSNSNCSIFTVKDDDSVYFGNNEDEGGDRRRTDIWFGPPDDNQSYGCVYVGFAENEPGGDDVDGIEIGGMNSEGLCFDGNGILPAESVDPNETLGSPKSYLTCGAEVLRECATVEEVIVWYQTHNVGGMWWDQAHFADKTGDAVVVSPAGDGGIAFTRITGDFLISTNFNVDHPGGPYYPCIRYATMNAMLQDITTADNVTINNCAEILEAVHVSRYTSYPGTVYSNIFDLKQRMMYLYIWGNYSEYVTFNLTEELAKGYHGYIINDLAEYSPEELFSDYNLWPIEPTFGIYSLSFVLVIIITPSIGFSGYWIFIKIRNRKLENKGGKEDGT